MCTFASWPKSHCDQTRFIDKSVKAGRNPSINIFYNNSNIGNYDDYGVDSNVDDDQHGDRNDNDGTGCVVGEAGVCTDPDQTLHLSVLSLLGRVIMMIAMMLIEG